MMKKISSYKTFFNVVIQNFEIDWSCNGAQKFGKQEKWRSVKIDIPRDKFAVRLFKVRDSGSQKPAATHFSLPERRSLYCYIMLQGKTYHDQWWIFRILREKEIYRWKLLKWKSNYLFLLLLLFLLESKWMLKIIHLKN